MFHNHVAQLAILLFIYFNFIRYYTYVKESISVLKILTGTPSEKRSFGRPRRRWEDDFRMDLKKIGINMRNSVFFDSE